MIAEELKKDFPLLQNRNETYLDSGATTQKPIQVIEAVDEYYKKYTYRKRESKSYGKTRRIKRS